MVVQRDEFDTAEEYMVSLSPQHPFWAPHPANWLFRGHGNHNWVLTPAALRAEAWLGFGADTARGIRATHEEQVETEFRMLDQFLVAMNQHGHPLPPNIHSIWFDWARIHSQVERAATIGDVEWPLPELYGVLALAQHQGIATRLLDWSRHSRVAAFFAAERAATWLCDGFPKGCETDRLSVWAYQEPAARALWEGAGSAVQLIAVPQHYNANLRAQRGVFTVHAELGSNPTGPPAAVAVDELLRNRIVEKSDFWRGSPPAVLLREMTLPITEARRLLRLLSYEGITSAALFPNLEGVVRELSETRLWD